jgi:phosphopantothenoylcysteine decarboxylase/phosphopantothenate--cysteine ligase
MQDAVRGAVVGADALIMAAAVADYRPAEVSEQKIKKGQASMSLELQRNPDILGTLSSTAIVKVGFAAETMNVVAAGRRKLEEKRLDLMVANDVAGGAVFSADYSRVHLIDRTGQITDIGPARKTEIAEHVLDALVLTVRRAQNSAESCAPSSISPHEN